MKTLDLMFILKRLHMSDFWDWPFMLIIKSWTMEELIKQAEQGDAKSQVALAMAYLQGEGVEENLE